MEQKSPTNNQGKIIDSSTGKPFGHPEPKKSSLMAISRKIKIAVVLLGAFIAFSAAFFENVEKLINFFKEERRQTVPLVVVKISNSGNENETIYGRGDFVLWLPGPSTAHLSGKYELLSIKGSFLDKIVVKPKETIKVSANVMNEDRLLKIFSNGDCDLSLILYREKKHLLFTDNIPFTENALKKYYLEIDVGKK